MVNILDSQLILKEPHRLVGPGVYALVDETQKKAFIGCSNNLIKGIADVVTKMVDDDHCTSYLVSPELRVLYLGPNPKFEGSKLIQEFEKNGYRVLNRTTPVKYTAKVRVLYMGLQNVAVVTLRSARGNERVVAAFKSMGDCEPWFEEHYPNGFVSEIVEMGDELTEVVKHHFGQ